MTSLKKLAYEILRLEYGENVATDDSQLSPNYVMLLCRQACNIVLKKYIYERINEDDRSSPTMFIVRYTVNTSGSSGSKTLTLPEFYQHLPFNKGLHGIATTVAPTTFFIPRHSPEVSNGLPCADLEPGQHSFWTMGFTVSFSSQMNESSVYVYLLVAAPDTIGATDSLPLYADMQIEVINIVRQMIRDGKQPLQERVMDPDTDFGKTRR